MDVNIDHRWSFGLRVPCGDFLWEQQTTCWTDPAKVKLAAALRSSLVPHAANSRYVGLKEVDPALGIDSRRIASYAESSVVIRDTELGANFYLGGNASQMGPSKSEKEDFSCKRVRS